MTAVNAASPRVSLLIAVRNEGQHLAKTLASVCAQDCPLTWLDVVVLDGGSTDDTVEIAQAFATRLPRLRVVNNPGILSAAAWNLGLRLASAPLVSILSGHALLPTNYFSFLLKEITQAHAGVGVRAVPQGDDERSSLIAKAFLGLLGNGGASFMASDRSGPVESIAFGCYWRHILQEAGGFDERIVRGQDWDLNLRLRAGGHTLWYLPKLEIQYFTRSNFRALWQRQYLAGKWKRYIHEKSRKPFLKRHLLPALFVAGLGAAVLSALVWPPTWFLLASIVLSHQAISLWQFGKTGLPWHLSASFWWAVWLIHTGYGAGMIMGFAMPVRPASNNTP